MEKKTKKVNKSVSLNPDVYERLLDVCERLGVNVNAYLVNAIGQQLQRDEAPIHAQNAMIQSMTKIFADHMESEEFEEQSMAVAKDILENKKP
jgi:hypothetical protein